MILCPAIGRIAISLPAASGRCQSTHASADPRCRAGSVIRTAKTGSKKRGWHSHPWFAEPALIVTANRGPHGQPARYLGRQLHRRSCSRYPHAAQLQVAVACSKPAGPRVNGPAQSGQALSGAAGSAGRRMRLQYHQATIARTTRTTRRLVTSASSCSPRAPDLRTRRDLLRLDAK